MELIDKMRSGNEAALARLISLAERNDSKNPEVMQAIQPLLGNAFTIGITGPPGAGKSSLTNRLTQLLREQGFTVGIIAIDPSSPFSGGAVLGDRVRMEEHYLDPGVYIRSMASRGSHGGLARATKDAIKILDAAGKDFILVETVGVGQTELDVMQTVDTVCVVLVPEGGDAIQMLKAGLMEIADLFAVNKSDRDGAPQVVSALKSILHLKYSTSGQFSQRKNAGQEIWEVPVCPTQGISGEGVLNLLETIRQHQTFIKQSGELDRRRKERRKEDLLSQLQHSMRETLEVACVQSDEIRTLMNKVENGTEASHGVIHKLLPLTLNFMLKRTIK
ncbi:MAG: methylmalonyl Co-A mutase-associated GTPase MeaB [Pseudomonadales bacterium]|nr:methylmalonyl Co-A mutase-associated GTPase MeaB [Pseudomonadales bacterium]